MTPCRSDCPAGDCAGCAFPPGRARSNTETMSVKTPQYADRQRVARLLKAAPSQGMRTGIHQLVDLRVRCAVDPGDPSSCWSWPGRPVVWMPRTASVISAQRAAWKLAGMAVADDERVFRFTCNNEACVHPLHGACATTAEHMRWRASAGLCRADGERRAQLTASRMLMMTPPAIVAEAERMLEQRFLQREVAERLRLSNDTVRKIKRGQHPFSRGRAPAQRGSSVWSLA